MSPPSVPVRSVPVAVAPTAVAPVAVRPPPIVSKTAASGVPIVLDTASSVDPNCHPNGVPTGRVTQPPVHGKVALLHQSVYPNFPPNNSRSACNKTKVPGIATEYTSAAGFTGSDFTTVSLIFPDGKELEVKFAITVK